MSSAGSETDGDPLFLPLRVGIAGNIAAGKTTLAQDLSQHLGYRVCEEPSDENEYLSDFYEDKATHAFACQVAFLASRFSQHARVVRGLDDGEGVVMDRGPHEDVIFARLQHERGDMDDRDFRTYLKLFDMLIENMGSNTPDAIIYLRVPPKTLMRRIDKRGRAFEKKGGVPIDYLIALHDQYEKFIAEMGRHTSVYAVDWTEFKPTREMWGALIRQHTGEKGVFELTL